MESPYELRSKLKSIVTKSIVKRTEFSDTIVKIAKAMLVAEVELEFEQESEQGEPLLLSQLEPEVITV
jgi:hypothetical protein